MDRLTQRSSSFVVESPFTVSITDIDHPASISFARSIAECEYLAGSTFGFDISSVSDKAITANLLTSRSIQVSSYDATAGELVSEEVTETSRTPFRVDFERGRLEVYGDKQATKSVRSRLTAAVDEFEAHPTTFALPAIASRLAAAAVETEITALRITDFSPEAKTSGNCYLSIEDTETAHKLLAEYGEDISYLGTTLTLAGGESVSVGFYRSGSVRLFSNTEREEDVLELLLSTIETAK